MVVTGCFNCINIMRDKITQGIFEAVMNGEPSGFFHEYQGSQRLIYLRRTYITNSLIWKLVIDSDVTDEVIELGWKAKGVSESDARIKAHDILKEKGIDHDISDLTFNWDGST